MLSQPRIRRVLEVCRKLRADRLLDIGCGDGEITLQLRDLSGASQVFGVDISAAAVEAANQRQVKATQLNIDETDLPFGDSSFDLVYCGEVLEHLLDPDHLLHEILRVLHPAGHCIITTPNLAAWTERVVLLLGRQPYSTGVSFKYPHAGKLLIPADAPGWEGGHIRVMALRAFRTLLDLHGFTIVLLRGTRLHTSTRLPLPFDLTWRLVDWGLSHRAGLAPVMVALVRKRVGSAELR